METVKMPGTVRVNTGNVSRSSQAGFSDQSQSFVKLLQEKKDMAEPNAAQTEAANKKQSSVRRKDDRNSQDAESEKKVRDKVSENAEDADGKEDVTQEVLLQAGMWQTAAQMKGMLEDIQDAVGTKENLIVSESTVNVVGLEAAEDSGLQTAGSVLVQTVDETAVTQMAAADQAVYQAVGTADLGQQESSGSIAGIRLQVDEKSGDTQQAAIKAADTRQVSSEPVERTDYLNQEKGEAWQSAGQNMSVEGSSDESRMTVSVRTNDSQGRQDKKVEETGQEPVYQADPVRQPWQSFTSQRTEEIPLKTSQSNLPQDLGKTLAARLPGGGQELVIELEPAALGKLTIKLAYEGGRAVVSILASNPKTLEILNEKASEIAAILEEKTGQNTIIYTHAPEQQQNQDPEQNRGNGGQEQRQDQQGQHKEDQHQTESFAQQLRLGLI